MSDQLSTTYGIDGMTCGHCAMSIDEALTELPSVTEVSIDLVAGGRSTATVTSGSPLDDAIVRAAIEEAGYTLVAS